VQLNIPRVTEQKPNKRQTTHLSLRWQQE